MANTWEWKKYDDGSGGLRKPDGSSFFSYDKATKEYIFASDAEPGFFNDGNWRYYGDREQFNLKEFAENAAVNDSINKAFEVSKNIIEIYPPTNKFPYPSYTKEEKCQHISKALDEIINAIDINGVKPEEIEALVRGKDAAEYGEKALYFIRPNAEQIQAGLDWDWELGDVIKGYTIGENGECSKGELSVIKIDDMQLFDSDAEAAEQAKEDGVKLIPKKELSFGRGNEMRNYRYIDTPKNRKLLSRYISTGKKLDFSWERFTEEDFNKKKNELLNKKDWNGPALIDVGAVNIELHDPEYSSAGDEPRVFLDYYIGGDTSEHSYSYGTDIPYGHVDGSSIPISKIVSLSYEEFKNYLENEVTAELHRINNTQNKILLEAERPTVNFDDPKQGAELYITKLAEKVDLAEQKDSRTWPFVRDNHPGYHDGDGMASDKIFSNNDVYRGVVAGEMSVEDAEKYVELRGTKADFAREFIRTEKEILDNAIENWQPEESDKNGDPAGNVPGYIQKFHEVVNEAYSEMDKAINIIDRENEKEEYIHSEEFISKFGDWEKINRLEKLKNAPTLKKDGKVVIDGTDYTDKISEMRNNEDRKGLREIMSFLKKEILGSYTAPDMDNESIDITSATMKELNRFPLNSRQIEATLYIPDLLKNGTFICNEKNEDLVTNPEIDHYSYLLNGIKIAGEDYTAKSVIAVAKDGKKYYDHKLSKIEKGRILNNLPLLTDRESLGSLPYDLNDNRLLRICQVPQMPYLEMKNGKWRPTQESIEKVRAGKLYIEQDKTQGFLSMVDESKADRIALDFRDEYNAQKAKFEPSMTYETARDVVAASGIELIGKDFDETNGKGVEVDAKLIFNRAYANARATPDVTEDFSLSSVINFNNLTKQADKAFAYMNSSIEYVAGIPDHNSVSIGAENNNVSYLALLKNADFEKCVERAKKEFRNLIETAPAEEMTFNQQTFEYFKKNASVIFRSSKESLREFWKTVEQTYVRDDIEKEKESFLDSLSGSVLNTTLEIDDEKTVRQYFVYTNKNLPGIKQEYDKDGKLVSDLRLVVDIDNKTNELDNISIDRINSVTGDVDYDVQVELSNDGKKILHTAEKEIKEYLLNEVAKQEKDFKIENIDDGNDSAQGIADKEAKEKFGYSWQDKTDALSDLLDAHGEVTDPDGHPTDLDHMIHYFEENTPLEGHRRNLEKAVSHMLMFTIDDFKSLSPAKYDYIAQDGAAAEVRGELCDRIANDLVSGKINNSWFEINKEVETYSKELARREVEKQAAVQKETVKEDVFGDFVSKVEAEYKDLNLFLRSASNVLKQLPPEKKDEVRKELLKRGANTPEKLAVVMRNAIKAKQNSKSQQPKNAQKKRDDYGMER